MRLYPNSFIPKLHFLKHYVYQAKKFGSLRKQTCLAFEWKHQAVKNVRHYNYRNIPFGAAKCMLTNTVSSFFNASGKMKADVFSELDEVVWRNGLIHSLKVNGITYKAGDVISTIANANHALKFHLILEITTVESRKCLMTKEFTSTKERGIYSCILSEETCLVNPNDLILPWIHVHLKEGGSFKVCPLATPM